MSKIDQQQSARIIEQERRLAALEYNVRRMMAIMKIDWQDPPESNAFPPEVLEALAAGDKLRAIKELTTRLGIGLAEAKEMIERGHK